MARIFTTPEAECAAKVLMHNITVAGGVNNHNLLTGGRYPTQESQFISNAKLICDELVNRDFSNIDRPISVISMYKFVPNYTGRGTAKHFKPEAVAKAIVYLAEALGLYWDDTIRTPYEITEFQKTFLGSAVYKYGRYISAIKDKTTSTTTRNKSANSTQTTTSAPQNGYKQSGPQSGNVRDLQGVPGQKVTADTSFIYKIVADKIGKNTPNVFIKPLSTSGASGSTNKIFISSGNGYTDCTCYFDDPNEAQAFLDRIVQNNRVPVNIENLRVVKMKADPNGYFLVGTEFGICAVSAKTLNEALTQATSKEDDKSSCWENATKCYTKEELDELHTWMRRD